ncbi:MAG: hypothetical protein JWM56_1362 [Candidatus Peribacteria bacterium]|nr:hypothetical protein [Candidatus Peribacteria bacterium]
MLLTHTHTMTQSLGAGKKAGLLTAMLLCTAVTAVLQHSLGESGLVGQITGTHPASCSIQGLEGTVKQNQFVRLNVTVTNKSLRPAWFRGETHYAAKYFGSDTSVEYYAPQYVLLKDVRFNESITHIAYIRTPKKDGDYSLIVAPYTLYSWGQPCTATVKVRTEQAVPPSPGTTNTSTIQGYKVASDAASQPEIARQVTTLTGPNTNEVKNADNPFYYRSLAAGTYTMSATVPDQSTVGYTICTNTFLCHSAVPTSGNTATFTVPAKSYVDIYWHYTKKPAAADNAAVTNANFKLDPDPGSMQKGTCTVKNTGTSKWTAVEFISTPESGIYFRAGLPALPVAPGETAKIDISYVAPGQDAHTLIGRMHNLGGEFFGAACQATITPKTPVYTYDAELTEVGIPGTMVAGQTVNGRINVRNKSSIGWRCDSANNTSVTLASPTGVPASIDYGIACDTVPAGVSGPGGSKDLLIVLSAPKETGLQTLTFQMKKPDGTFFGSKLVKQVTIVPNPNPPALPTGCAAGQGTRNASVSMTPATDTPVPDSLASGQSLQVNFTLRNNSATPLRSCDSYIALATDDKGFQATRVLLPEDVAPGATVSFSMNIRAPSVDHNADTALTVLAVQTGSASGINWPYQKIVHIMSTNPPMPVAQGKPNDATYVSDDLPALPATLQPNRQYTFHVTWLNSGNTAWNASQNYRWIQSDTQTFQTTQIIPVGTRPGEKVTVEFLFKTPPTPGTYTLTGAIANNDIRTQANPFGYVGNKMVKTFTVNDGLDSATIGHTIPPAIATGNMYSALLTMKNTGTTPWSKTTDTLLLLLPGSGEPTVFPLTQNIAPNGTFTFFLNIVAPPATGTYVMQWRMKRSDQPFGESGQQGVIVTQGRDAIFTSDTISALVPGVPTNVMLNVTNNGGETWYPGTDTLKVISGADLFSLNAPLPREVAPKDALSIPAVITAADKQGSFRLQISMAKNGKPYGRLLDRQVDIQRGRNAQMLYNDATGRTFLPNAPSTIMVTMKNTGTSTWTRAEDQIGSLPGGNPMAAGSVPSTVAPGESVAIPVLFTAPGQPGMYTLNMTMIRFADRYGSASIPIEVKGSATDLYKAEYQSDTFPPYAKITDAYITGSVTFLNTGAAALKTTSVQMQVKNISDGSTTFFPLPFDVPAGQKVEIPATYATPAVVPSLTLEFSLIYAKNIRISQPGSRKIILSSNPKYAKFISNTIPTAVEAGKDYTATVRVQNTGPAGWETRSNSLKSTTDSQFTVNTPLPRYVDKQASTDIYVTFTAPSLATGTYHMLLQMYDTAGFGDILDVPIRLTNNGQVEKSVKIVGNSMPATVAQGSTFTVEFIIQNTGTATIYPGGDSFICDTIQGQFSCKGNLTTAIQPNGKTTIQVTAKAPSTGTFAIFNGSMVSGEKRYEERFKQYVLLSPGSAGNTDDPPTSPPVIRITKQVDKTDANRNDIINYTIWVINDGNSPAKNIVVSDALPEGLTFQPSPGCEATNNNVTCKKDSLTGNGNGINFVIAAKVETQCAIATNMANIRYDGGTQINSKTVSTVIACDNLNAHLQLDVGYGRAEPGGSLSIKVTIHNTGNLTISPDLDSLVCTKSSDFICRIKLPEQIKPNEEKTFTLSVQAPTQSGDKWLELGMSRNGNQYGNIIFAKISVQPPHNG